MQRFILLAAFLVTLNLALWYVFLPYVPEWMHRDGHNPAIDPVLTDVFVFTLEEEVRKKTGVVADGYVPADYLSAFPGLVETDFEGVAAAAGYYTVVNGRLTHTLGSTEGLVPSEATIVSRRGMETLLYNVATRVGVNLETNGTITDIMRALTQS